MQQLISNHFNYEIIALDVRNIVKHLKVLCVRWCTEILLFWFVSHRERACFHLTCFLIFPEQINPTKICQVPSNKIGYCQIDQDLFSFIGFRGNQLFPIQIRSCVYRTLVMVAFLAKTNPILGKLCFKGKGHGCIEDNNTRLEKDLTLFVFLLENVLLL